MGPRPEIAGVATASLPEPVASAEPEARPAVPVAVPSVGLLAPWIDETLLKSTVLMAMYSIRSKRAFCERLNYDLLFKWFVDVRIDQPAFDAGRRFDEPEVHLDERRPGFGRFQSKCRRHHRTGGREVLGRAEQLADQLVGDRDDSRHERRRDETRRLRQPELDRHAGLALEFGDECGITFR